MSNNKTVEFEMTDLPKSQFTRANSFTSATLDFDAANSARFVDEDAGKVEQIKKNHLDSLAECFNQHVSEEYTMNMNIIDTVDCEQNIKQDDNDDDHRRCYTISLGEISRLRIFDTLVINIYLMNNTILNIVIL